MVTGWLHCHGCCCVLVLPLTCFALCFIALAAAALAAPASVWLQVFCYAVTSFVPDHFALSLSMLTIINRI